MTFAETSVTVSKDWPRSCPTAPPCRAWPSAPATRRRRNARALRDDPSEVLLTTPESLAVLLSQPAILPLFAGLRWVIVDEVHALAPTKRGADLALSLERLSAIARTLQRVGLSATAAPLAEAARFLTGVNRSCAIAEVCEETPLELRVVPLADGPAFLADLIRRLVPELRQCRRHPDLRQHAPLGRAPGLGLAPAAARLGRSNRRPPLVVSGGAAARGGSGL